MSLAIGQVVGGYEIIGTIGAGGMGTVYKVRNAFTDRVDAMKVLTPDPAGSADLALRFSREIKIHASLRHPNIAELYTAMQHEGQLLMVMEFVEGITLADRLQYGTMGIREAIGCMCQMLSALEFAHRQGVIHRDIKPSNVMLTPMGTVKLLDFGIASGGATGSVTNKGMVIGSVQYMAPEQIKGGDVDGRTDVYAAGCTLYQMLTGKPPFEGANPFAVMHAQTDKIATSPSEFNGAVEPGLSRAIMKSLEKIPEARFQSADKFRAALEAFNGVPMAAPAPAPSQGLDPAVLEMVRNALAKAVGPVAKLLMVRAAKKTQNIAELGQILSQEINNPKEREAFLAEISKAGKAQ